MSPGDHRLVMFGAPGSGKGTQAALLAETLRVPAISTGEMLRAAVAAGTDLGHRVQAIMAAGALVDDGTMADVVRDRLAADDARRGFILDGYPRTIVQAEALERLLEERGQRLQAVLHVRVPEEELVRRALARQRADDIEEIIRERLRVYREQTRPLAAWYRDRDLLVAVDGHQSIEEVAAALAAIVLEVG